eukprot:TRINITY_DN4970_c0_g1_i8.p1 TRINITY_DN4970_c0_g1~~TRINITY_DN4970_c0_g1_i8.p1  ORF type:complete len:410 (-),score=45.25 TRINITY_DN4970_c0_g1_i8:157-1386(-)
MGSFKAHAGRRRCLFGTLLWPGPCPSQELRFTLIYVISTTAFSLVVLPLGAVLDKFGPKVSSTIGSTLILLGSLLFAFSSSTGFDAYLPGFLFIGIGGPPIVFSFMHLSNLFPAYKGTIITLFNVGLDASSLMFQLLYFLWFYSGLKLRWLFVIYAIFPSFSLVVGTLLWPNKPFPEPEQLNEDEETPKKPVHVNDSVPEPEKQTFFKVILSSEFWLCAMFTTLNLLRVNFYIGSVEGQLSNCFGVTEAEITTFTNVFGILLPLVGVTSVPLVGWIIDRFGLLFSIFVLTLSGNIYGLLSLLTMLPVQVQVVTFVMVALFRALLFSVMATYVAVKWGMQDFGKLWGIIFFLGGIINVLLYLLGNEIQTKLNNQYFWPNAVLTIVSLLLMAFPFYLLKHPPPKVDSATVH